MKENFSIRFVRTLFLHKQDDLHAVFHPSNKKVIEGERYVAEKFRMQ